MNIAAAWATSAQDGLFNHRQPAHIPPSTILFHGGPLPGWWIISLLDDDRFDYESPLRNRGWVLQERLLSPRRVSFCADYVRWQCCEPLYTVSERYPCASSLVRNPREHVLRLPSPDARTEGPVIKDQAFWDFLDVAHHYTYTALSYANSDKFLAFAALAQYYSTLFGKVYVAGFLRSHLPLALGWCVQGYWQYDAPGSVGMESPSELPPAAYRPPSWSWAKTDYGSEPSWATPEVQPDPTVIQLCDLMDCCVVPVDPRNPYGQLIHASLTLRARLTRCSWNQGKSPFKEVQCPEYPEFKDGGPECCFDSINDLRTVQDEAKALF